MVMELAKIDLEQFWRDDALAHEENCFSQKAPQVALGIRMSDECVFSELGEPGEPWGHTPRERRIELNKRYNDKAERIVGRRLLNENFPPADAHFPATKRIGEVFGGEYVWYNGTEWLKSDIDTPQKLEARLDIIDKMDLRSFILPADWERQCKIKYEKYGLRPGSPHGVRGPVTLACSIFGIENLIYLIEDEPGLAKRFSDAIADTIIKMTEITDAESGKAQHGFGFADDNCCMLNAEMYEFFAYPILERVFSRFCPEASHQRYQHSDSEMAHLLPVLGRLGFHGVNFGPGVTIDKIREYMPKTRIDGCLAPFTFMNYDSGRLIAEAKRDCEMAKRYGRGVNLATAGSINDGSSLENMRAVMWAICEYGRY
jgi:uroporphyrinogen decarboxylase